MRVAILGGTGETGSSITNGLLESSEPKFDVTVLVRPSSLEKPKVLALKQRGVKIVSFDTSSPEDKLTAKLKDMNVLISSVLATNYEDQIPLVNAAKKAGVKRFVPCFWATVMPATGVLSLRDEKEKLLNYIQTVFLPYTVIDVGWWYQLSLPRLPSGRFDRNSFVMSTFIAGDGNVPCGRTDMRDVGKYTARIIADPRTLNQKVFAYTDLRTQNELYDTVEKLGGEKIERRYVSADELDAKIAKAESDPARAFQVYQLRYQKSWDLRGDNTPEYARYLGYQVAKDLYPDLEGISFEDFCKETLEKGLKPLYQEYQQLHESIAAATASEAAEK